jgi:hypothetical protein
MGDSHSLPYPPGHRLSLRLRHPLVLPDAGGVIPAQAVIDRSFPAEVAEYLKQIPWWRSFGFWATILVACVVALYVRFF